MILGYHTAGLLHHDPVFAIGELARIGFGSVAIRPHATSFQPELPCFGQHVLRLANAIEQSGTKCVLDLNSPFLPDPWLERGPSLVSSDPKAAQSALDWIVGWMDVAAEIGAELLTFSAGDLSSHGSERDERLLERLAAQVERLVGEASGRSLRIALHPRRGDAVATVAQFERLAQWLSEESGPMLSADVGEMLAGGELPLADRLARNLDSLACVYLCDRRAGQRGDQPIGEGEVALTRILQSLRGHGFVGHTIARVEAHSNLGLDAAKGAWDVLQRRV